MSGPSNRRIVAAMCLMLGALSGCRAMLDGVVADADCGPRRTSFVLHDDLSATRIEYPDVARCNEVEAEEDLAPNALGEAPPKETWDLTLAEAISLALEKGDVLRDLGGRTVSAADSVATAFDPALRDTDPLFGTEAALSAFDTQMSTGLFWQNNDRVINNETQGGGVNQFNQDQATFQMAFRKTAATGTEFSVQNLTVHDANNASDNLFLSSWDTQFSASLRHPLLQRAGIEFNRIAGPNAQPGFNFSTGVLIARINTDVVLADFEAGTRDFLSQVEDAYWELYSAYRELDSRTEARDSALETWRVIHTRFTQGELGGEALNEARAREQYYMFKDQVDDALSGSGGRVPSIGVYRSERRLRRLLGLAVNDGRVIRPADEPSTAPVSIDWREALTEAMHRRVELRRQRWRLKQRELELVASRNFTLPQLDAVAQYRLRGFGDDLTGSGGGPFGSAFKDLRFGDHHEWEVGLQMDMPLGFRRAWSGVRHAELQLARERAVLGEQERQISHDLADTVAEMKRAHVAVQNGFNRLAAAIQHRDATQALYDQDLKNVSVDMVLDAQERLTIAQSRYYRSLVDFALAQKNVHFQKGSLLQYNGVLLSEGAWPMKAYTDAIETGRRWPGRNRAHRFTAPKPFSLGEVPQEMAPAEFPIRQTPVDGA